MKQKWYLRTWFIAILFVLGFLYRFFWLIGIILLIRKLWLSKDGQNKNHTKLNKSNVNIKPQSNVLTPKSQKVAPSEEISCRNQSNPNEENILNSNHEKISETNEKNKDSVEVAIAFTQYPSRDIKKKSSSVLELERLDFGIPLDHLGCFLNYSYYLVIGINECGEKQSKHCTGVNEQQAIEKAIRAGMSEPFKVKVCEYELPTDRQLACIERNNVLVPDWITKDDASYIIDRVINEDFESPEPWLVSLARGLNTNFSAYTGKENLFSAVIHQADNRNRAALFVYGVQQSLQHKPFGNMLQDPKKDIFYQLADLILKDDSLFLSWKQRETADYKCPNKNTNVYKFVKNSLIHNSPK